MYLEFAGLPGSGKSTLSSSLKRHLVKLKYHAVSRNTAVIQCIRRRDDGMARNILKRFPSRIWWPLMDSKYILPEFVTLSSRHLEFITFLSKVLSESNLPELLIESIWGTIVRSFSEIQLVLQHISDQELVIMDEAFSQRCFTLFGYLENTVPDDLILRYAELAPISHQVFWIVTDPLICVERFMKRYEFKPLPFDFQLEKEELLKNFKSGNSILQRLSEALESQGKCVHRIDGDGSINESIEKVCKAVSGVWWESFKTSGCK